MGCLCLSVSVCVCFGMLRDVTGGYGRILAVSFCLCLSVWEVTGGYGRLPEGCGSGWLREVAGYGGYRRSREVTGSYGRVPMVTDGYGRLREVTEGFGRLRGGNGRLQEETSSLKVTGGYGRLRIVTGAWVTESYGM